MPAKLAAFMGAQKFALTLLFTNLSYSSSLQIPAYVDFKVLLSSTVKTHGLQPYWVWLLKLCFLCKPKGCRCGIKYRLD